MKRFVLLFSLLLLFSACSEEPSNPDNSVPDKVDDTPPPTSPSVSDADKEAMKQAIHELKAKCDAGNLEETMAYMTPPNKDASEVAQPLDYGLERDQITAEKMCAKIAVMFDNGGEMKVKKFFTEKEKEGTWYLMVADFIHADGREEERILAFLKGEERFLLGDID